MPKKNTHSAWLDATYLVALDAIDEGVLFTDVNQHIIYVNPAFTHITGYTLDDLQGKSCHVLQGPGTNTQTQADIRAAFAAGQTYHGEILNYCKNGAPFWNELTINPVRDAAGLIIHFVSVQRDISTKKTIEAELAIRQELMVLDDEREMYQRVTDLIIQETDAIAAYIAIPEIGNEWLKISATSADQDDLRADLLALTPSRDPGHLPFGMMLPSRAYREKQPLGPENPQNNASMRAIQAKHPALYRVQAVMAYPIFVQGQGIPAAVLVVDGASAQYFTAPVRQFLTQLAITVGVALTQLRHHQDIAEAAVFNTSLFNTLGAVAMVINRDGEIVRMNHITEQFMGYSFDEVKGQPYFWERFIPEDERSRIRNFFEMMHDHAIPPENDNHWVNRFGEKRLFHWINTILDDADGQARYMITIGMDITDQKNLEQNLQAETAKNYALLHYGSDGIHILDEQGYLIEASNQFCIMMGYSCDEMLGMHVSQWDVMHNKNEIDTLLHQQFESPVIVYFESKHRRKDGSVFNVENSGIPIEIDGRKVLFNSSRDITKRKVLEVALRDNAQRLQRLSDFNMLMAQVNQSIATDLDEQQLLQNVCDLAIRYAHLELAVIARPDASGRFQYPVTSGKIAFLDDLRISNLLASLDPNMPEGQGAYANVWREEQPLFIDNALSATFAQHWHAHFRRFDIKSYAVLPLFHQGRIFGLFVLYHSEESIFDHDLSAALMELARDISRGLDRIDLMHQERAAFAFNEALLNSLTVGVNVMRYPDRVIEQVNPRMLEIYGATSMGDVVGHSAQEFYPDTEILQRVGEFAQTVLAQGNGILRDVLYRRLDGALIYVDLSGQKLLTIAGEPERIVWTHVDVTERHRNEEVILRLNAAKEALLANTVTGIDMVQYPERIILEANRGFLDILGYEDVREVIGHATQEIYPDHESDEKICSLVQKIFVHGGGTLKDVAVKRKDGQIIYLDISGQLLEGENSDHPIIVWTSVDVTERHQLMEDLSRQSLSDLLTGLPNRRALDVEMERAMARADRNEKLLAVCMLDLDDFKPVNDTYGHDAGDLALQIVAQRLRKTLRKTDFIARLGGDEFVLLVENLDHLDRLKVILDKVVEAIQAPITLDGGQMVSVGLSMGVSIHPFVAGGNSDILLRLADQALYENKAHKEDRLHVWTLYGVHTPQRENKAQKLLHEGGLRVFYQPILGSHGRTIIGIEALARLQDGDGRILSPAEFLPMLAHDDLFELSSRVLDQALHDLKALDQNTALWVSVNIDPRNVSDACVACLRDTLAEGNIAPKRIYLEILEGSNFDDQSLALTHLDSLKALGIRLALDDIGSAYSSLLRLKDLPIDKIKLDQGFIRQLEQKPKDLHFVASVLDLANGLGLELVVEGVETDDILDAMVMLGIPSMQGYAIAYPLPFTALRDFLLHAPSHPHTQPSSLLGLYAKQLANHNALKKAILQNPHLVDRQTLQDACVCPIHHDLNRLQILDGDIIHTLHRAYHHAIAAMSDLLVVIPTSDDWGAVDGANDALQNAIVAEYRKRKSVADEAGVLIKSKLS